MSEVIFGVFIVNFLVLSLADESEIENWRKFEVDTVASGLVVDSSMI